MLTLVHRRPLLAGAAAVALERLTARGGIEARAQTPPPRYRVLAFSRTTGFRHDSIPDAIAAVQALAGENGFAVDATEDPATFTDENLAQYSAVIFLLTTGHILDEAQQALFERFIASGNGYVGIHSASDTEYDWAWYAGLVGAYFASHPDTRRQTSDVRSQNGALNRHGRQLSPTV